MSIAGTTGVFSYGVQADKDTIATTFYRHKAADIDFAPIQTQRGIDQEVGGAITPTGQYKTGAFVGGGASIAPRMEGDFGWLIAGVLGKCTSHTHMESETSKHASHALDGTTVATGFTQPTAPGRKLVVVVNLATALPASPAKTITLNGTAGTPTEVFTISGRGAGKHILYGAIVFDAIQDMVLPNVAGATCTIGQQALAADSVYDHVFTIPADQTSLPWMTFRKLIPGGVGVDALGEVGLGCRIAGLGFTFPNGGIINSRVDALGCIPSWAHAPAWTYADIYESHESIPLTCNTSGYLKFPDFSADPMKVVGAQFQFQNQLSTPEQEKIIGNPHPDDITVLGRNASLRMGVKWQNPELYAKIFTNNVAGTTWSDVVFTSSVDLKAEASKVIGATAYKYGVRLLAPSVVMTVDGPIRLQGGGLLGMSLIGGLQTPDEGTDYVQIIVTNGQATYTLP